MVGDARIESYLTSVFGHTSNAFQSPTSAVQEWVQLVEAPKLACPNRDDLVAVIAQTSRPSCRNACDVFDRFVNACSAKVEGCDGCSLSQYHKELVQGEDVVWSKNVWTFACNEDVEVVADPVCKLLEFVAGDVGSWGSLRLQRRCQSGRHGGCDKYVMVERCIGAARIRELSLLSCWSAQHVEGVSEGTMEAVTSASFRGCACLHLPSCAAPALLTNLEIPRRSSSHNCQLLRRLKIHRISSIRAIEDAISSCFDFFGSMLVVI